MILHPCRSRPLGASLRLAPACGQRFGDFQPDQGAAVTLLPYEYFYIAFIPYEYFYIAFRDKKNPPLEADFLLAHRSD